LGIDQMDSKVKESYTFETVIVHKSDTTETASTRTVAMVTPPNPINENYG